MKIFQTFRDVEFDPDIDTTTSLAGGVGGTPFEGRFEELGSGDSFIFPWELDYRLLQAVLFWQ
jgi:hypothetical protein